MPSRNDKTFRTITRDDEIHVISIYGKKISQGIIRPCGGFKPFVADHSLLFLRGEDISKPRKSMRSVVIGLGSLDSDRFDAYNLAVLLNPTEKLVEEAKLKVWGENFKLHNKCFRRIKNKLKNP